MKDICHTWAEFAHIRCDCDWQVCQIRRISVRSYGANDETETTITTTEKNDDNNGCNDDNEGDNNDTSDSNGDRTMEAM